MRPLFRFHLTALFTSTALLAACGDADIAKADTNIKISLKASDKSSTSTVQRTNDDVTVKIEHNSSTQQPENFAFKCSDQIGLDAAYQRAAAEIKELDALADHHRKSISPDLLDKPDQMQKIYKDLDNRNYAHIRAKAIQEAGRACKMTVSDLIHG